MEENCASSNIQYQITRAQNAQKKREENTVNETICINGEKLYHYYMVFAQ